MDLAEDAAALPEEAFNIPVNFLDDFLATPPRANAMTAETSSIPIVDFAAWHESPNVDEKKVIAAKLVEACRNVGFVYIINHTVSPERLAEAFEMSKRLFELPREKKMLAPHPAGFSVHRGYSWPGLEKVSNAMGDEEDEDLAANIRKVADVKVPSDRSLLRGCRNAH